MHTRHSSSALRALYNVFVAPTLHQTAPPLVRRLQQTSGIQRGLPHLYRNFSLTRPRLVKTRAPEQRAQKWDEEIKARMIYLIDPETNMRDPEPRTRFDILNSFDRSTHRLVQLSPDEPGNPSFMPVCKVVNKKEQHNAELARKKAEKEKKAARNKVDSVKTLELNWAIDENDLQHRLEKVESFLKEGRRVEVVLARKKRGRSASVEECQGVLRKIEACVDSVEGAREMKGLEGKVGGFATMVFQGRGAAG